MQASRGDGPPARSRSGPTLRHCSPQRGSRPPVSRPGLEFLGRHRDHPLIQRLDVIPLSSQFPSTTTAHVPSVHFGMPVHEHGLYEWNILEPTLGEIICPLRFDATGAEEEGTLVGRLEPSVLAPGQTFYESLTVPCIVAQPFRLAGSFSAVATRGAQVIGFRRLREGVRALGEAFAAPGSDHRYALLYWDLIDRAGHDHGPGSPEFAVACRRSLDELWDASHALRAVIVLITADHGPDRRQARSRRLPRRCLARFADAALIAAAGGILA